MDFFQSTQLFVSASPFKMLIYHLHVLAAILVLSQKGLFGDVYNYMLRSLNPIFHSNHLNSF